MIKIIQMVHRLLLFLLLPGSLSAQDFPDIRVDTTTRTSEFFEGRYYLHQGQGGEFWELGVNSTVRFCSFGDVRPYPPGDEAGRWNVKGDSLILQIEKKNFWWRKKKLPFNKGFKIHHLRWSFLADANDANKGVPHVVYLTVLIDDKEIIIEALIKEFIAFVRSETIDVGITLSKNTGSSTMLRMVSGMSSDFFGRQLIRPLFYGFKAYRNGQLVKEF